METALRSLVAVLLLAAAACESSGTRVSAGTPTQLALIDTVILSETDSAYLGIPQGFQISETGDVFIVDALSYSILQYGHDGKFKRRIGRKGRGPGEFSDPTDLALIQDSLFLVQDNVRGGFVVLDGKSAKELKVLRATQPVFKPTVLQHVLVGSAVSLATRTMFARWREESDTLEFFGAIPPTIVASAKRNFVMTPFVAWPDTFAFIGGLSDVVFRATASDGRVIDSLVMPKGTRRGLPPATKLEQLGMMQIIDQSSLPYEIGHLSGGRLAVVFFDGERKNAIVVGKQFLTIASRSGEGDCIDIPIPNEGSAMPRILFRADTMYVLEQISGGDKATTVLRRFALPHSC